MEFLTVLERFADVTEHGDGGYLARCPAHSDSRPSLRIWRGADNKVRITCRAGCLTSEVIKAVDLRWADLFNATGAGSTVTATPPAPVGASHVAALAYYVDQTAAALWDHEDGGAQATRKYLAERFGIDRETAVDLELGYSDVIGMPYLSRAFRAFPRLTVPFKDFEGNPRALQGRDVSGRCPMRWVGLTNPEGSRWAPYGVFKGQGGYGVTLITEGPGDALTAVSVGYDAVAVRGASLASSTDVVAELADALIGSAVVFAGDRDAAGSKFVASLANALAQRGVTVSVVHTPEQGWDLTDWRGADPERFAGELHSAIADAKPISDAEVSAKSLELDAMTGTAPLSPEAAVKAVKLFTDLAERYGESDVLSAHALVAWTAGRIKYAPGLGFYIWDGRVWVRSEVRIRQEIHRMGAALMLAGDSRHARPFTTTKNIDNLMKELRSVPSVYVDPADFDARPHLLSFRNGTVNLRTGVLRPHAMADMLTVSIDLDYDPDATCPRWEAFLEEIMPGMPGMADYLRRLVGYGITGSTAEQCFAVLYGKGANGKSVFTDVLTEVFGSIVQTTPFATFEDSGDKGIPNDIAALRGSRLVMASEGEAGKRMSEAVLKRVTGKDKVTARFLRQEFFTFAPTFLILLATNHRPNFRGQDEGLWRRVKLIPFTRYFAPHERDYALDRALLDEAAGIVAWAVRGAVEWYRDGLKDPAVVSEASREYRATSDALSGFLPGVFEKSKGTRLLGSEVFNSYLDWCEAENLPARERWTRRAFYAALEERGVTKVRSAAGMALEGIAHAPAHVPTQPTGPGIFA